MVKATVIRGVLFAVLCAAILVGCDRDGDRAGPETARPSAIASETAQIGATAERPPPLVAPSTPIPAAPLFATSAPEPRRTGLAEIDAILEAFERRDAEAVRDFAIRTETCVLEATQLGGPPVCEAGESPQHPIEGVWTGSCHGVFSRDPLRTATQFVEATAGLFAVVPANPSGIQLVFHALDHPRTAAIRVTVVDGRIESMVKGCARGAIEEFVRGADGALPLIAGPWLDPTETE